MKRISIVLIALLAVALLPVHAAYAHVFISDTTNTQGAIIHINPDDDPVAGQPSTLYFDTQTPQTAAELTVENTDGLHEKIKGTTDGSLAVYTCTFPAQGVYNLTFTTTANNKTLTFRYDQRVSRGTIASATYQPTYPWAEALFIASCIGLALIVIVAFNRRKAIAKHSTF